jgi:putative colanic acid biosynthesis acetyltransferase WcaF
VAILDAKLTSTLSGGPSFTLGNRIQRALWSVAWVALASWTPPSFFAWRAFLLRCFGADIAPTAMVRSSARIWYPPLLIMDDRATLGPQVNCYNIAPIHIKAGAIVSQGSHLCAGSHDISDPFFQLVAKPIVIGEYAWVAAEAFVGPGVTVGEGAVLGARGVAFRDLEAWTVYVGNPASAKGKREHPRKDSSPMDNGWGN